MELAKSGDVGTPPPASKSQQEELAEFIKEINDKEKRNKKIAKGKKKGEIRFNYRRMSKSNLLRAL